MPRLLRVWLVLVLMIVALPPIANGAHSERAPSVGPTQDAEYTIYLPHVSMPTVAPSAQELIYAALANEEIDYGTSLLYRAYALFGDPRLPPRFQGSGSEKEDQRLFAEVQAPLSPISDEVMAQLQPFVMRPDDPQSIFSIVAGDDGPAAQPTLAELPCYRVNGWAALASVKPGVNVKIWARCTGDYEDDLTTMLEIVEELWGPMTRLMGQPIADSGGAKAGDGPEIDIYLLPLLEPPPRPDTLPIDKDAAGSTVRAEPFVGDTSSGYIKLRRAQVGWAGFRSTVAHELFHVLQFAHNQKILYDTAEIWWFGEASAEWASTYFVRDEAFFEVHPRFTNDFQRSEDPLHLSVVESNPKSKLAYAAYIWPFFIEQERGPQAIGAIWRDLEQVGGDWDAAHTAIDAQLSFGINFHRFALRNLNTALLPGDPIKPRYNDLDVLFPDRRLPKITTSRTVRAKDGPFEVRDSLPALKAHYHFFRFTADVLQVELDLSQLQAAQTVDVDAVVYIRKNGWQRLDITNVTQRKLCDVEKMYLVVSNHASEIGPKASGNFQVRPIAATVAQEHTCEPEKHEWLGTLISKSTLYSSFSEAGETSFSRSESTTTLNSSIRLLPGGVLEDNSNSIFYSTDGEWETTVEDTYTSEAESETQFCGRERIVFKRTTNATARGTIRVYVDIIDGKYSIGTPGWGFTTESTLVTQVTNSCNPYTATTTDTASYNDTIGGAGDIDPNNPDLLAGSKTVSDNYGYATSTYSWNVFKVAANPPQAASRRLATDGTRQFSPFVLPTVGRRNRRALVVVV